jgi:prepilin peptidase CpaA
MPVGLIHVFPNQPFAWGFFLILLGFAVVAAAFDLKTATIPKWLTLAMLAAGFLANIVRKSWLAEQGQKLWLLDNSGWWVGALDGLLFAFIGAAVAFVVMFILWILGSCGGGDVKLFTAVGAWVGLVDFAYILAASIAILAVFFLVKILTGGVSLFDMKKMQRPEQKLGKAPKAKAGVINPAKRRMTYSLPICIAACIVLLIDFGVELGLQNPPHEVSVTQVQHDGHP